MSKATNLATLVASAHRAGRPVVALNRELWVDRPCFVPNGTKLILSGSMVTHRGWSPMVPGRDVTVIGPTTWVGGPAYGEAPSTWDQQKALGFKVAWGWNLNDGGASCVLLGDRCESLLMLRQSWHTRVGIHIQGGGDGLVARTTLVACVFDDCLFGLIGAGCDGLYVLRCLATVQRRPDGPDQFGHAIYLHDGNRRPIETINRDIVIDGLNDYGLVGPGAGDGGESVKLCVGVGVVVRGLRSYRPTGSLCIEGGKDVAVSDVWHRVEGTVVKPMFVVRDRERTESGVRHEKALTDCRLTDCTFGAVTVAPGVRPGLVHCDTVPEMRGVTVTACSGALGVDTYGRVVAGLVESVAQ